MIIWVDADACPKVIKEIIFRAALRVSIQVILVANQLISTPPSFFIKKIQVLPKLDAADDYILQHMNDGDLIITADIPLANLVVEKGGFALNPRGIFYDKNNIKKYLAIR